MQRRSAIPLISIVQAACDHAKRLGLKRLALVGTGIHVERAVTELLA